MIRRRVVVHGFVQGVFFRDSVRRHALTAGVTGWVRNNRDGTVEAVFEGEDVAVERLVGFCRDGPRGARVDRVEVEIEEPEGLRGFSRSASRLVDLVVVALTARPRDPVAGHDLIEQRGELAVAAWSAGDPATSA